MMRNGLSVLVCLVMIFAPASVSFGESRYVTAQSLYIRMNPRGFFLGTLYINAGFHRRQTSGDYAYGWGTGNYQGCGWVETAHTAAGGSTPANCSTSGFQDSGTASRQYLLANYARNVNDYVANAATPLPLKEGGSSVRIKVGSTAGFYGNYRGGTFQNRVANLTLDSNSSIAWRWVSDDGRAVAVNLNPGTSSASWGFIPREDLPDKLPYSDGISR
ncbi:MAG: hypothetical protein M3478_10455 [Planctomycetota bacterium]|nr:hypothetical protein [Planctomycetota bacterium]